MADLNLGLLIFLVVLLTQIVSWVGKSVLQEVVRGYPPYSYLTSVKGFIQA